MVATRLGPAFVLFGFILRTSAIGINDHGGQTFTDCGGVFEQPKGVIQTPDFPGPYPTPIYCDWLIRAPQGKKIIIYFTQYYMKDSFYVTSYKYYQDRTTHLGQRDLGRLSVEHDLVSLVAYQPFVLLQFSVESIGNRHLRVMDFLLEVYGFNITYEIVDKTSDVTKPTCSVKECSYLGNCLAAADFSKYECECFPEFFGKKCQYGPYCQPDKNINQCHNGGKCKYFFGSLINQCECPPGYAGAYCDIPESGRPGVEFEKECKAMNCSQVCDISESGEVFCSCLEGYEMHKNNGTCKPIARYRIDVTLELQTFMASGKLQLEDIKDLLYKKIKENGVATIEKYGIKGFRNTSRTTVLEFYFYCMVSEVDQVNKTLQKVIDVGSLGTLPLLQTRPKYEQNPALLLSEVANYDPNPTLRGSLLTLVCAAKGSSNLKFRWYKDDYAVNTNLTSRNAWEAIIPHTIQGMRLSVLNIDKVSPLDAGRFICMASDFGETQMGGVDVNVNNYPRVQLYPMSLSVPRGQSISITCLSPDDSWLKFHYEWFKNGVKIEADSKHEYMEAMRPTGVRLVVSAVVDHAEYTCKVTNEAGDANVTAYVHVFSGNETGLCCPRNYEGQVMWQNTSGGHFDIKPCPTDQGVVSQYGPMDIGYAKRHCVCDLAKSECSWLKPNFAKCQSLILVEIYDEMELLKFGYQKTTLRMVFNKLYQIICPRHPVLLYSGDIDMIAHILKDLIVHMRHFPQLVIKQERISADELVETMSGMLQQSSTATSDEKNLITVGPCIIQITNTLLLGSYRYLEYAKTPFASYAAVSLDVFPMERIVEVPEDSGGYTVVAKHKEKRSLESDSEKLIVNVLSVSFDHLSELLTYRERSKNNRPYLKLVSRLHSMSSYDIVNARDTKGWKPITVRVKLDHTETVDVSGPNTTICLSWNYDPSNLYFGEWMSDRCTLVKSTSSKTVCECLLPGHFIAAVVHSNRTLEVKDCVSGGLLLMLIGYSIALLLILIAFVVFVKLFSQLVTEIYTVHLITITSLTIATVIDIVCIVHIPKSEAAQQVMMTFLIYLYFVMFTGILAEAIQLFIVSFGKQQLVLTKLKFVIGCLGFPVVLLLPTIFVSRMFDNAVPCHQMCWFSSQMRQFYAFILPVITIVICFLTLVGLSIWKLHKWNEEWRYADKVQNMKSCGKATIVMVLLAVTIMLSVDLKSHEKSAQPAAHVIFYVALRLSVLLFRCFLDKQIRFSVLVGCFGSPDGNPKKMMKSSSSFRAFVKPERVQNISDNQEEYNVSKYYDEINRTKYSADRTRQLSSLLGSSMCSGESSGDTRSTTVTGSTLSSKECDTKAVSVSGGNWTLNDQGGYSRDTSNSVNSEQQLVKVSSFIRSDDDVMGNTNTRLKNGAPAMETVKENEKKQTVPPQRNPPSMAVSAQYDKKSNSCSINTPTSDSIPYRTLYNKTLKPEDTEKPKWTCGGTPDVQTFQDNENETTDPPDEYHVLIHQAVDLQGTTEDDQALTSSKLL